MRRSIQPSLSIEEKQRNDESAESERRLGSGGRRRKERRVAQTSSMLRQRASDGGLAANTLGRAELARHARSGRAGGYQQNFE